MKPKPTATPVAKVKMYLVARVPNEGARRLAWWIGQNCDGDLQRAAWRLSADIGMLPRLLDGSISPGSIMRLELLASTDEAVQPVDWYRPAYGGWCDAPGERPPAAFWSCLANTRVA